MKLYVSIAGNIHKHEHHRLLFMRWTNGFKNSNKYGLTHAVNRNEFRLSFDQNQCPEFIIQHFISSFLAFWFAVSICGQLSTGIIMMNEYFTSGIVMITEFSSIWISVVAYLGLFLNHPLWNVWTKMKMASTTKVLTFQLVAH